MADYSEWLEAIAGTEAVEDYMDLAELEQQTVQRQERDAVLCLVDCQHAMFGPTPQPTDTGPDGSPFRAAALCVLRLYRDKVITSDRDLVALVLYNAGIPHNIYDFPGVHIIHPFGLLGVESVQELEELAAAGDISSPEYAAFERRVGHASSRLSDVLWAAQHMFLTLRSGTVAYRRVFVFTCDDTPHGGDALEVERCLARVRDLHDSGVTLEVFAMGAADAFCRERFWAALLQRSGDAADAVHVSHGACTFAEVLDAVRRRVHPQRPYQSCHLSLGTSTDSTTVPTMAVSVYNPLMPATAPRSVWLDGRTHNPVKRQARLVVATAGEEGACEETVSEECVQFAAYVGGRQLRFASDERRQIISAASAEAPVGFTVLCVKPMHALRHKHALRRACLLHPNPRDGGNASVRLFALFARTLERRGAFALAQCISRRGAVPRLVALLPSPLGAAAWLPAEGAALYAVPLPYAEDLRPLPATAAAAPPPHSRDVALAARVIAALSAPYDVAAVPNPALQQQYQALQRLARRRAGDGSATVKTEERDFSLPDREAVARNAQVFHEFNTLVLPPGYNAEERCPLPKSREGAAKHSRAQAAEAAGGVSAAPGMRGGEGAASESSVTEAIARVEDAFARNALAILTVVQLKAYLAAVGETAGAARRKDDIVEIVKKSVQKRVKKE